MGLSENASVTISGRLKYNDPDDKVILEQIDALLDKGYSKADLVVEGLRLLCELDSNLVPYADNDKGELARLQSQRANQSAIMAQFDILNERIDLILDKLDHLKAHGIEITPDELAQDTDIPDSLMQSMRERYHNRNR